MKLPWSDEFDGFLPELKHNAGWFALGLVVLVIVARIERDDS